MHLPRPKDKEIPLPRAIFQIPRLVFLRNLLSELLKEPLTSPLMIVAMSAIGFVGLDGLLQRPPVNELSQLDPTTNIVNLHLTIRWVSPLTPVA
jgi:hypothetical protein